jgi:hypothetical protein
LASIALTSVDIPQLQPPDPLYRHMYIYSVHLHRLQPLVSCSVPPCIVALAPVRRLRQFHSLPALRFTCANL